MTITTNQNGETLEITLSGRLDSATAGELEETLEKEMKEDVGALSIDLSDVDFISSRGLRVLVAAYRKLGEKNVTLLNPNPSVTEVLKLSGLLKIFTVI